jgi:hypothetical protein
MYIHPIINKVDKPMKNTVDSTSSLFLYSSILGGQSNIVCGSWSNVDGGSANTIYNCYSGILSGQNNKVCGCYSSILGGFGNTVPVGCQLVGIFGCNITAVANKTLHVNCLNANALPLGPGGTFPAGTFYYQTGVLPAPFAACKVVFVQ